jgi:WD40-like Beta Propeller Repeat
MGRLGLPSRSGGPIPFTANGSGSDGSDLWIMNADGTHPRPFLQSTANTKEAAVSPSGKWIAYVSDETGEDEVWAEPFPNGGPQFRISQNGGDFPVWLSDSRIVFESQEFPSGAAVLADLDVAGSRIRVTGYRTLLEPVTQVQTPLNLVLRPFDATPERPGIVVAGTSGGAGADRLLVETDLLQQLRRKKAGE